MEYLDVVVDLETLDNKATSVVLSIGAVAFTQMNGVAVSKGFHEFLRFEEQFKRGRTASASTLMWWFEQGNAARIRQVTAERLPSQTVLTNFKSWLFDISNGQLNKVRLWGNGAAFDNAILASLYHTFDMDIPWHFWNDRCYRTMKALSGTTAAEYGVAHDALDDAIKQALHLVRMLDDAYPIERPEGGVKPE